MNLKRLLTILLPLVLAARSGGAIAAGAEYDLIVRDALVYKAPGVAAERASIAIRDGRIAALGKRIEGSAPRVVEAGGRALSAGLWNSHVHFTDPALIADPAPVIRQMLLRYGFTRVLDTGSDPATTSRIRQSIVSGDYAGPRILRATGSFVTVDGTPSYLPGIRLPELRTASEAEPAVNAVLADGAEGIKIFSGSFQGYRNTAHLPGDIIRAVSRATHARGAFVIAHPTDLKGLSNAVDNGVDILAHSAPDAGPWSEALIERMLQADVALVPTLQLWRYEAGRANLGAHITEQFQGAGIEQVAAYHRAGGEILFGTDVGYMPQFDPTEEYRALQTAGLDFTAVLASLTTAPARRFGSTSGEISVGEPADLVIYRADPATDVRRLSSVHMTLRAGTIVYCEAGLSHPGCPD